MSYITVANSMVNIPKRQKMDEAMIITKQPSLLSRTLMTIDGNLLSAFFSKGSCIPDKLVDKKEVMVEIVDGILQQMKSGKQVADTDLLHFLGHHRRGSAAVAPSVQSKPATLNKSQRRSWGPDNTWASQFVMSNFTESVAQEKLTKRNNRIKDRPSKELKPKTQFKNRYSTLINPDVEHTLYARRQEKETVKRRKELMKMTAWIISEDHDYIHTEQAKNPTDVEIFLDVMLSSSIPVQMTFKVNSPTDISITYQFLPKFKEDYMILKISRSHCMVMRAF